MNSPLILSIITFIYGSAALLYITAWIFRKNAIGHIAFFAVSIGILNNLAGFGLVTESAVNPTQSLITD